MNAPKPSDASRSGATPHPVYAVIRHGGHQYRVTAGDRLLVDRLGSEVGAVVGLEPVLLLSGADGVQVDGAGLEGVRVAATVTAHRRGKKLRVFTFKPKKRHRRTLGFRAELTELVVDRVLARGEPLPEPVMAEEAELEPIEAETSGAEARVEAEVGVEADAEAAVTAPRGRRGSRARPVVQDVGEAGAPEAAVAPAASAAPEVEAPARRRSRKPAGEPAAGAGDAMPAVAPEAPAPPARRARKVAATSETETPEAGSPEAPPARPAAPARRRITRTSPPPEAGE